MIFSAGKYIFKVDKTTGEIVKQSEMVAAPAFGISPITYGGGMVFVQTSNGRIQAFDAETLESLWVSEQQGGQSNSPIVYSGGYVYTGFWTSEVAENSYVCLSVTDEDPDDTTEVKEAIWKHTVPGGFYWAGGVVIGDYIVFGSDDGTSGANGPSKIYSLNRYSGEVRDTVDITGDQRSTIVYEEASGKLYFTTKSGYLYSVEYNSVTGKFDKSSLNQKIVKSGWQITGTPVVYKGRLYIGAGSGFANGIMFVLNADTFEIIYEVPLLAYPQGSPLLTTAYEEATGKVVIYTTYNGRPGGLTVIEDAPGQTMPIVRELFTPDASQQQYCLGSPIADSDGTLYYHNDTGTIFAITNTAARGDVNSDGLVTALDATLVLQNSVALMSLSNKQESAADVDGDGQITATDAMLILRYVVGLISEFPESAEVE